jgi:hypothetical protein
MSRRAHAFDYLNTNWVQMTECVPALGTRASRQIAVWIVEESSVDELTLWQEDPPAKTSPWLDAVAAWMAAGADCSGTSAVSLMQSLPLGFCGRTSLELSPATTVPTSLPCCGDSPAHSPTCPMAGGAPQAWWSDPSERQSGGCLTLAGSEWPNDAAVCSLSQVLEDSVGPRYYLSPKACAGILRRAGKRGKPLPAYLEKALAQVAATKPSEP